VGDENTLPSQWGMGTHPLVLGDGDNLPFAAWDGDPLLSPWGMEIPSPRSGGWGPHPIQCFLGPRSLHTKQDVDPFSHFAQPTTHVPD